MKELAIVLIGLIIGDFALGIRLGRSIERQTQEKRIDVLEAALRKLITVSRSEWVSGEWVAKVAEEALKGEGVK